MLPKLVHMLLALAAIYISGLATDILSPAPVVAEEATECTSIDIRNDCSSINSIENCSVILGYLIFTLVPAKASEKCNYSLYAFPKLREVTGFMIFNEIRGIVSIRHMFPNLTVIRGRRLFLNYALGVTNMPDLQLLEFQSLVAIQRGHVYIGTSPKLCQLNGINWDRLTLSLGENHIFVGPNNCTSRATCKGCESTYCWSNFTCQRFENDNVAHYDRNSHSCHEECLGGCYNATAAGCMVCRGLTNAGVCVNRCPPDKYLLEEYQRCYTQKECVVQHGYFTFKSDCVPFCPGGYRANKEMDCVRCNPEDPCIGVCSPDSKQDNIIYIYNLADAERLHGCQIINSSLMITIRSEINEQQLEHSLSTLREIRGHLKIYRSSELTSLKCLRNLRRIYGDPLESNLYALIVYDNKQLSELWETAHKLKFTRGGMFMHRNNKLCNKHMKDFQTSVFHDNAMDSLQTSDQEVLCGPTKLQLQVQSRTHRTMQLTWSKAQTSEQLELIYKSMPPGKMYSEKSELEAPVCTRINWQRLLLFADDLLDNGTHYSYKLDQLQPNTRYVCLLRTFGGEVDHEARSDLIYVQTQLDIPKMPTLKVTKISDNTLTLLLGQDQQQLNQDQDYYMLSIYELVDNADYIDERDYCRQPAFLWQDMDALHWRTLEEYDYDDCCARQEELADDQRFIAEINDLYRCSLDTPNNCVALEKNQAKQLRLPANTTLYELRQLERYRLYSLQLQACNTLGCSSPTTINERTNFTLSADQLPQLSACRVPKTQKVILRFKEPKEPNGLIVNYVLHYRNNISDEVTETHLSCVTRRDHAEANFVHVSSLNSSYNECAVRVHSMAGDVMTNYVPITECTEEEQKLPEKAHPPPVTMMAELAEEIHTHARGISIFVFCFVFGCSVAFIWLLYKRRCWRKWPSFRRYVPVREQWLREQTEDREILVDGFETVRFQNNNNNSSHEEN